MMKKMKFHSKNQKVLYCILFVRNEVISWCAEWSETSKSCSCRWICSFRTKKVSESLSPLKRQSSCKLFITISRNNIIKEEEVKNDKKQKIKERITSKLNVVKGDSSDDSDDDGVKIKPSNAPSQS